jgi:hypothetical protein
MTIVNEAAAAPLWVALAPWFTALAALAAAVITARAVLRANARTVFVDAVTKERAQWRADVRAATEKLAERTLGLPDGKAEDLHACRTAIRLRLNPLGGEANPLDRFLLDALRRHEEACGAGEWDEAVLRLRQLEGGIQLLLKSEWEKSKREARNGEVETDEAKLAASKQALELATKAFLASRAREDLGRHFTGPSDRRGKGRIRRARRPGRLAARLARGLLGRILER